MQSKTTLTIAAILFVLGALVIPRKAWALPVNAIPYAADIAAAEWQNGIPPNLLARLLYQESRFRDDVISGTQTSGAGAVGIAQIVPRWHPDVDATDAVASIHYAANYLAGLFERFGSWDKALAGYNWGPTAVAKSIDSYGPNWLSFAPTETQNYVAQISKDVLAA